MRRVFSVEKRMEDRYFHITDAPVPAYTADSTQSARRTALRSGKPVGFWYAKGGAWASIVNSAFRVRGVTAALEMSMGLRPLSEHPRQTLSHVENGQSYYIYELPLATVRRTTDVDDTDARAILVLNAANIRAFIDTYAETIDDPATQRDFVGQYIYERFSDVGRAKYLQSLLEDQGMDEDETLDQMIEEDEEQADMYVLENYFDLDEFIPHEDAIATFIGGSKLYPTLDWIRARFWAKQWIEEVPLSFGGVEFSADVLSYRDPRAPWITTLGIPSGCIFNPLEFFGVPAPTLFKVVSLDPTDTTPERNVYGQRDGVVYRAVGGRRAKTKKMTRHKRRTVRRVR